MEKILKKKSVDFRNCSLAKDIHSRLHVNSDFDSWFADRVERYNFEEGVDYVNIEGLIFCTDKMHKMLAMVEENEIGNSIREFYLKSVELARTFTEDFDYANSVTAYIVENSVFNVEEDEQDI